MTPDFIESIADARLRRLAGDVWARLPEYAKSYLAALAVPIRTMTKEESAEHEDKWQGFTKFLPNPAPGEPQLSIVIRVDLPDYMVRFALAHEWGHLVLQHHLRGHMGIEINPQPAAFLRAWEDEQAVFLQTAVWPDGWADFNAMMRATPGPGPRWLETYQGGKHASRTHLEK